MNLFVNYFKPHLRNPAIIVFLFSTLTKTIFGFIVLTDTAHIISDPDSIGYYRLAENLRHHGVFSRCESPPFFPDNVLTPVYPFFLAALLTLSGGGLWIVAVAQIFVNSLAAVLVFKIGERWFDVRAGLIAGICYGLDPSALVHSFSLLTESLFAFVFLAANFLLMVFINKPSTKILVCSAILLGLSTLCRPVALYYCIPAAAILFFAKAQTPGSRAKSAIIFLILFFLFISPWLIRNQLVFGIANLTCIQGNNLLLLNVAYLKAAQERIDYLTAERLLEMEADSLLAAQGISTEKLKLEYHGKPYGYQINDPLQARVYEKLAREKIMASPLLYLRVHLAGLLPSLLDTSVRDIYHFRGKERPLLGLRALLVTEGFISALKKLWPRIETSYFILSLLNLGWLIAHYIFAFVAICRLGKEKSFAPIFLMVVPIIYLIFMTLPAGSERFRFPAMPYLYVLSGFAISRFSLPSVTSTKRLSIH